MHFSRDFKKRFAIALTMSCAVVPSLVLADNNPPPALVPDKIYWTYSQGYNELSTYTEEPEAESGQYGYSMSNLGVPSASFSDIHAGLATLDLLQNSWQGFQYPDIGLAAGMEPAEGWFEFSGFHVANMDSGEDVYGFKFFRELRSKLKLASNKVDSVDRSFNFLQVVRIDGAVTSVLPGNVIIRAGQQLSDLPVVDGNQIAEFEIESTDRRFNSVIVKDLLPVEVEQEGYTSAKGIRFCRWLDAFPGGLLDPEFADKDRDRFRIKIPVILPELTKIKLKSTGLHGAVIDGAVVAKATDGDYEVEMKQENGAMVSNWILLVSDGDDDKGYNGKGTDDGKDDQTLLADFGSKIIVTLPGFSNAEVEFTAQKPLGNITLDTVYLSPAGDVPQDIQALIHRHIAKMQEIYRQIGVRVAWASIEGVVIPQSWLNAVPNPDPTKPDIEPANQLNDTESQSARALIRNRQVPAKHIRIGYVDATMKIIGENFSVQYPLGFTELGTDGIVVSLGSSEARRKLGVTAHEVGHTFGLDHVDPEHLLMKSLMSWNSSRRDSKRFEEGNFNTIKSKEAFYVPLQ